MAPLDESYQLTPVGEGDFTLPTDPRYWNTIGPYGGWVAGLAVQALLSHGEARAKPVSITVNFAGPLEEGQLFVRVRPVRQNRAMDFWQVWIGQIPADAAGKPLAGEMEHIAATALIVTAPERESLAFREIAMPDAPPPERFEPAFYQGNMPAFGKMYQQRVVRGAPFTGADSSHSLAWMRDDPVRPLDAVGLAAIADLFFPRMFFRLTQPVFITTLTMSVYLYASPEDYAAVGEDWLLGECTARMGRTGLHDQQGTLWSRDGRLLATTEQLVYFKA